MSEQTYTPPDHQLPATAAQSAPPHRSRLLRYLLAVVVVAVLLLIGLLPRRETTHAIDAQADQQSKALPIVQVMTARQASSMQQLTLRGTVTPTNVAHIFARAAGYLKVRYVDLGDKVHRGQLLATISAPDLDAAVLQRQAIVQQSRDALAKAKSQKDLQQATYDRVHTLVLHGVLS